MEFDRDKIVQVATDFYQRLYEGEMEESINTKSKKTEDEEAIPPFLEGEVFSVLVS